VFKVGDEVLITNVNGWNYEGAKDPTGCIGIINNIFKTSYGYNITYIQNGKELLDNFEASEFILNTKAARLLYMESKDEI